MKDYEYLLSSLSTLEGVGQKTTSYLKKKNINNIFDLLWHLPLSKIENSKASSISDLKIGKTQTIKLIPIKYNFPRIKRLPNKVICINGIDKVECIFFNSFEGYIKKILPLNQEVAVTGRVSFFNKRYQLTNPKQLLNTTNNIITDNKYSLTEGISLDKYKKIVDKVLLNLPDLEEWLNDNIKSKFNNVSWKDSIIKIHTDDNKNIINSVFYRRLIFDEIFAHFLISSKVRTKIKKIKKEKKNFKNLKTNVLKKLNFKLTKDQNNAIDLINVDLKSKQRMFRLLQGDVGSGKTIVAIIAALNVVSAGYQVGFMVPTEILAKQHYEFVRLNFNKFCNVKLLTGKTEYREKKITNNELKSNKVNLIIGTHSLFQKKVEYKNLGLIIIDEQHKFGVRQRKELSDKGGKNCDVLVMSATPIPRTMVMTIYGDMDVTLIKEKPKNRIPIKTYSKLESKIIDVIKFVKNQISLKNQIFWVCPLIEESKKLDHQSAIKKYEYLNNFFPNKVGLIHGSMDKFKKNRVLKNFLNKKIDILVSTTVIEVGIDFPNANVIIIENANKYGLSQLHQLRGRVGRGSNEAFCILMFKSNLSENAKKRIKILKSTNDGFKISEEDMKLRGYGDVLGFKQSGIKRFRLADPILNEDLFQLAEKEVRKLEKTDDDFKKFNKLLKLYDKASIINELI
tara:strand:- start:873 stop:2909 length:2037 start_codon:yes stop_codon:yes gene_type:complete